MSDWSVLGAVIGALLGTAVRGPIGAPIGLVTGALLGPDDSPAQSPPAFEPYPGTTPGYPAFPGGPLSPVPPPPVSPGDSGAAADAADAESRTLQQFVDRLEELDRSAAATDEAVEAARAEARTLLAGLQHDVEAKVAELGPRLNSPDGQKELRDFLAERISSAKDALDRVMADAEARADETRERTRHYVEAAGGGADATGGDGVDPTSDSGGAAADSAGSGDAGGGAVPGADPAATAPPSAPVQAPLGAGAMPATGMMPGGMGMPSMPSFGGVPAPLGGDPFGGLGRPTESAPFGADPEFRDAAGEFASGDTDESEAPDPGDDDPPPTTDETFHDTGTQPAVANDPPNAPNGGDASAAETGDPDTPDSTTVPLPDGTDADARTAQGATAVAAALEGAPVAEAWQRAGVTIPPPGTPVTAPIPPTQLMAGDVGVWKDHLVMALGAGKVLVSGQVQPLTSVESGPDFLGWTDPSAGAPSTGPAATPPAPPSA